MEITKTVKYDGKLKGLHIIDGQCVTADGDIINIIEFFEKAYGDRPFDLSTTMQTKDTIDLEVDEVY